MMLLRWINGSLSWFVPLVLSDTDPDPSDFLKADPDPTVFLMRFRIQLKKILHEEFKVEKDKKDVQK